MTGEGTTMDTADKYAWDYLVDHWGGAYVFEYRPGDDDPYICRRRDDGLALAAKTVESLDHLVRKDYWERPVRRSVAP